MPAVVGARKFSFDFSLFSVNRIADYDTRIVVSKWCVKFGEVLSSIDKRERKSLLLRIVAAILLVIWLVLVLIGKSGFVHLFLLGFLGVAAVEVMTVLRGRMVR